MTGIDKYSEISVQVLDEHVMTLTLNRPKRLNALSFAILNELNAFLDELAHNMDIRVLIICGSGRAFCAGADLKAVTSGEQGPWDARRGKIQSDYQMQRAYAGLISRLRVIPQPIIAAVNGPAIGAGFSIAMASDIRLASPAAEFNCAFTSIGLGGGDMGSSYFLPKLVGNSLAAELIYTGRTIDAEEALSHGILSRIVEADILLDSARELALEIIANTSPFGLRVSKETLNAVTEGLSLEQALALENRNQVLALQTEDFSASVSAWVDRRKYKYRDH